MFKKSHAVAGVAILVLLGTGIIGCPPEDDNNNNGTLAQFTVKADSLVADSFFGKVFAVTHDSSVSVFSENQVAGADFLEFNFMNDSAPLLASLEASSKVTDVFATEDDLSGLGTTNTTLTITISGYTDDLFTIITPQFQTPSTFAALEGVTLPASGSQVFDLEMYSLNQSNAVIVEPGTTVFVRVTVTRN